MQPSICLYIISSPLSSSSSSLLAVRTPLAPVAVTMRCRQRPQRAHCLGDEHTRSASTRPLFLLLCRWLISLTAIRRPDLETPTFDFFFSVLNWTGLWRRIRNHNRNKQTPPPYAVPPSASLASASAPRSLCPPLGYYSHNTHLHICGFSKQRRGNRCPFHASSNILYLFNEATAFCLSTGRL